MKWLALSDHTTYCPLVKSSYSSPYQTAIFMLRSYLLGPQASEIRLILKQVPQIPDTKVRLLTNPVAPVVTYSAFGAQLTEGLGEQQARVFSDYKCVQSHL